ncbi:beta-lactamase hydrolase domain-containing protein [Nostoc sp. CCY 9925]|uniref:beta-lactamase hydrolase domain-containing protein n=1 Tax=Nostoc sp. CCY 9925 TaxID=3103865 RepID=UPI0039C65450
MENIKYINQDLAIFIGQPSAEEFQKLPEAGFKSVINLRSSKEEGFLKNEQRSTEAVGLNYVNIPLRPDGLNDEIIDQILVEIDQLPKPMLSHCKSGLRAATAVLIYIAIHKGLSPEEAFAKGKELGFDYDEKPGIKQFVSKYVSNCLKLPI